MRPRAAICGGAAEGARGGVLMLRGGGVGASCGGLCVPGLQAAGALGGGARRGAGALGGAGAGLAFALGSLCVGFCLVGCLCFNHNAVVLHNGVWSDINGCGPTEIMAAMGRSR